MLAALNAGGPLYMPDDLLDSTTIPLRRRPATQLQPDHALSHVDMAPLRRHEVHYLIRVPPKSRLASTVQLLNNPRHQACLQSGSRLFRLM